MREHHHHQMDQPHQRDPPFAVLVVVLVELAPEPIEPEHQRDHSQRALPMGRRRVALGMAP